jgi:hypothetical protein
VVKGQRVYVPLTVALTGEGITDLVALIRRNVLFDVEPVRELVR